MERLARTFRRVAAGLALTLVVILPAQCFSETIHAEFLFGVRAGDQKDDVLAQQGWYACKSGIKQFDALCFDHVSTLGKTGTYKVNFLDGRAHSSQFRVNDPMALDQMLDKLGDWKNGAITLVSFQTKNAEIDVIKAAHDFGQDEAKRRFSRFLEPHARPDLSRVTVVPLDPPKVTEFRDGRSYLDSLPPGGVILRLWRLGTNLNAGFPGATILSLDLPLADRIIIFPRYCLDDCRSWALPHPEVTELDP